MKRIEIDKRENFGEKLEAIGLSFHSWDEYWKEDACYTFTSKQVDELEEATNTLHQMCMVAVKHVIEKDRFAELGIPVEFWDSIKQSFEREDFSLYGRFDFSYDGVNPPKLLEYNADTPTSLLESAVAQWYWMEEKFPRYDQFNSLHERLIDHWEKLKTDDVIYFASIKDNEEDWVCVTYLMDTAIQAGHQVKHIYLHDIGVLSTTKEFVDLEGKVIKTLFKLYPWEWMMREEFSKNINASGCRMIEPQYKAIMSCKGLLPILWELYPNHKYLLPAYFTENGMTSYAKKPLYSREGANIELWQDGTLISRDRGPYGSEGYIFQELCKLPEFDGKYPVIGSWVVGGESAGMCIRECDSLITTNMSNFVPHYFN